MVSKCIFAISRSRLGLAKIWEGLGLSLVSNRKPNFSVSDQNVSFYKLIFSCRSSLKLVISLRCIACRPCVCRCLWFSCLLIIFLSFCVTYLSIFWCQCRNNEEKSHYEVEQIRNVQMSASSAAFPEVQ